MSYTREQIQDAVKMEKDINGLHLTITDVNIVGVRNAILIMK